MHIRIMFWYKSLKKKDSTTIWTSQQNVYDDEHMPFSEKLCQKETQTRKKEDDILYWPDISLYTIYILGVKVWNMKIDFNTGGT